MMVFGYVDPIADMRISCPVGEYGDVAAVIEFHTDLQAIHGALSGEAGDIVHGTRNFQFGFVGVKINQKKAGCNRRSYDCGDAEQAKPTQANFAV